MNRRFPLLVAAVCLLGIPPCPAQLPTPSPAASGVVAPTTPLTLPLQEETEIPITCELTRAPSFAETRIFETPRDADTAKGVWHYKLWLPKGYLANSLTKWPCMFIMSPNGNAGMGNMADHLKAKGYVVVMLVDSKNGPWGPVVGNFLAAHDDVIKRVHIDENKKMATGHSGGARGSSLFVQARPGFCGLILQSAGAASVKSGYDVSGLQRNGKLYLAMTMGSTDGNKVEVDRMKSAFNNPGRFRAFDFPGGHEWAPKDVFEQAITWIEQKSGI